MEINIVEHFNTNKRSNYWVKNGDTYKRWFKKQLNHLLVELDLESTEGELNFYMYRLGFGYWGIGKQSGLQSGLTTKDSMNQPFVHDHVFGSVEIGKYIHQEFIKYNYNIDYMVDTWLYENLWLWMTIKVSKKEHKKENILRGTHTIEEKKTLQHYCNVSEIIVF